MSSAVDFFYSDLSWECWRIRAFLNAINLRYKAVLAEFGKTLPFSVYGELPVLRHGNKIIEDHRLMLLYIDETFANYALLGSKHASRIAQLTMIEQLDEGCLKVLTALTLADSNLFLPLYMKELCALGKYRFYRARRKSRAVTLQTRYGISINNDQLFSRFTLSLKELSTFVGKGSVSGAVAICIVSALEMLRGENRWWKEIVNDRAVLTWLMSQTSPMILAGVPATTVPAGTFSRTNE